MDQWTDERLAEQRKKQGETDNEFMARTGIKDQETMQRWSAITHRGTIYGGPALRRYVSD